MDEISLLVVDDHDALRNLVRLSAQIDGRFAVPAEATDGDEAVRLARQVRPACVVLDRDVPGEDGLRVIPRLRAEVPDAVIVVFSARGEDDRRASLDAGADGYVDKGRPVGDLLDLLARERADRAADRVVDLR